MSTTGHQTCRGKFRRFVGELVTRRYRERGTKARFSSMSKEGPKTPPQPTARRLISVVVPIYNEEANIQPLHDRIVESLADVDFDFEVVLVDDGSSDESVPKLHEVAAQDSRFRVVEFRRNFGQTAAMMAGFDYAKGEVIFPMDGDLQNDPADIPRLLEKLDEGYDVVSGWRANRQDRAITRKLPSRIANWIISKVTGVRLNDYGCSLKAYRAEAMEGIRLYGEMHRFIPIFASWRGARITELKVNHHAREHGVSKYGLERVFKVVLDLLVLVAYSTLLNKPGYIFGGFGLINLALSGTAAIAMVYCKYFLDKSFVETPLPLVSVVFGLVGVMAILMGFLAEVLMRIYYESQGRTVYAVRQTHGFTER
ncbi:MAG: glycosyltransferase involved in cell wall biosynthesis [Rhodothermales bacterium]|jgi:glycosyltransferase involved in cell wall biosynthesis